MLGLIAGSHFDAADQTRHIDHWPMLALVFALMVGAAPPAAEARKSLGPEGRHDRSQRRRYLPDRWPMGWSMPVMPRGQLMWTFTTEESKS